MIAKVRNWSNNNSRSKNENFTVERMTKQYIFCKSRYGEIKFRRYDGYQVGGGIWRIVNLDEVLASAEQKESTG